MTVGSYTERFFPPPGAIHTADGTAPGFAWFPTQLLTSQLGTCCRCGAPAAYILAGLHTTELPRAGLAALACLPVCEAHACDLAAMTEPGHDTCPHCRYKWAEVESPSRPGGDDGR